MAAIANGTSIGENGIEIPIDAKALAGMLGCATSTIARMGAKGLIPSVLIGERAGARRYFPRQVIAMLEERSLGQVCTSKRRVRKHAEAKTERAARVMIGQPAGKDM